MCANKKRGGVINMRAIDLREVVLENGAPFSYREVLVIVLIYYTEDK